MTLTESEKHARDFFIKLICDGTKESCEDTLNTDLPSWYDEEKMEKGQKFTQNQLFLMMNALATGVIAAFADVRSLTILESTGKSSTVETARTRYASTILHFIDWFSNDLAKGTSARKSIDNVRKAHVVNSKAAKLKGIGEIKQFELVLTGFGFYGFSLLREDLTGIHFDSTEDKENFIHMWAIITRMVGVKDEFNICMLPLNEVEIVGRMLLRYILLPNIQLDYPVFVKMVKALTGGLGDFNKTYTFNTQMFYAKMFIGVPGYQYNSNFDNEILSKTKLLSEADLAVLNEALKLHMKDHYVPITKDIPLYEDGPDGVKRIARYIDYETEWHSVLNYDAFYSLSLYEKTIMRVKTFFKSFYQYSVGKYLLEYVLSQAYVKMQAAKDEGKAKKQR